MWAYIRILQGLLVEYKDEPVNIELAIVLLLSTKSHKSSDDEPMDPSDYLYLEGAHIYLTSRPDIQRAVSFGATRSVNPTRVEFKELIR